MYRSCGERWELRLVPFTVRNTSNWCLFNPLFPFPFSLLQHKVDSLKIWILMYLSCSFSSFTYMCFSPPACCMRIRQSSSVSHAVGEQTIRNWDLFLEGIEAAVSPQKLTMKPTWSQLNISSSIELLLQRFSKSVRSTEGILFLVKENDS